MRFIPAGAGNTHRWPHHGHGVLVYPRWRGEHNYIQLCFRWYIGLSPLARGTPTKSEIRWLQCRFIPAGAGNTQPGLFNVCLVTVYPRWRGEHGFRFAEHDNITGLSPLARGTQQFRFGLAFGRRFIPAGAGNTRSRAAWRPPESVYPRWRGEHHFARGEVRILPGLSPLARGTPQCPVDIQPSRRFIPAGAGNTETRMGQHTASPVYPRWRGEHSQCPVDIQPSRRFIPAGAGNTYRRGKQQVRKPVYPRWRGEHISPAQAPPARRGLSPLARGTPDRARFHPGFPRFIPAGAGNTVLISRCGQKRAVYPRWRGEHRLVV